MIGCCNDFGLLFAWATSPWRTCDGPGLEGRLRVCKAFQCQMFHLSPFHQNIPMARTNERTNDFGSTISLFATS